MQVASWNVNSVRTRLGHVTDWLKANSDVDVLCLQETKVVDADFPKTPFEELNYHTYIYGQKAYNGVALISKTPLDDVRMGFGAILDEDTVGHLDDQKRVISAVLDGVRILNLYVPNGSSIGSEKYDYKMRWLALLKLYLTKTLEETAKLNVCGDFNIALENKDIYTDEKRDKHIMSSPLERKTLQDLLTVGLADAFRKFTDEGGHFSWWDYRAASFRRNLGWRIDHHYLSPELYKQAKRCWIDVEPRKLEKPSDHTPVIVEY
ncbi:exodeoxyribonuclease III [Leptolyngbyaceae cyanobacterium CCMR0082]|uniref:Exodeoxyribonuclease III n=2 Tax=Adonisia turfae TaxID=2950184 RepID=A0A6M0RYJ8_9CYAN|nr:exodeoxyribonuclease III [Adonisia turfae]NEZ57496.1 exodeoxyribonuclease III [Adonisia turfae CCMR0081]NEZ61236.1 exodeoxyribonuclease III [Adonisia turfae CCMR0082]